MREASTRKSTFEPERQAVDALLATSPRLGEIASRSGAIIRVGFPPWLRFLLVPGVAAITLGRRIWISPSAVHDPVSLERLIRHELEHVQQVRREGLIPFLYTYFRDYLALRASGLEPQDAYHQIDFEKEATAAELDR